jgi:hypothetical protein
MLTTSTITIAFEREGTTTEVTALKENILAAATWDNGVDHEGRSAISVAKKNAGPPSTRTMKGDK